MRVSLQGLSDNPKDDASWRIYPPPPPPVWGDERQQGVAGQAAAEQAKEDPEKSFWAGARNRDRDAPRKPGHDIGEDFVFEECEVPGEDEMEYRLDSQGVFQVYENKKGIAHDPSPVQVHTSDFPQHSRTICL